MFKAKYYARVRNAYLWVCKGLVTLYIKLQTLHKQVQAKWSLNYRGIILQASFCIELISFYITKSKN